VNNLINPQHSDVLSMSEALFVLFSPFLFKHYYFIAQSLFLHRGENLEMRKKSTFAAPTIGLPIEVYSFVPTKRTLSN
jgi:hypothetical protein